MRLPPPALQTAQAVLVIDHLKPASVPAPAPQNQGKWTEAGCELALTGGPGPKLDLSASFDRRDPENMGNETGPFADRAGGWLDLMVQAADLHPIARVSGQALSRFAQARAPLKLRVTDSDQMEPIELPAGAVSLLMEILEAMAAGRGVTIIPENAELSTVQAAEVLNVSRPFLIKLLEDGSIPHRKVGKHRRVRMEDVMSYKAAIDREREAVLDQLAADAQEQDMGYRSN